MTGHNGNHIHCINGTEEVGWSLNHSPERKEVQLTGSMASVARLL